MDISLNLSYIEIHFSFYPCSPLADFCIFYCSVLSNPGFCAVPIKPLFLPSHIHFFHIPYLILFPIQSCIFCAVPNRYIFLTDHMYFLHISNSILILTRSCIFFSQFLVETPFYACMCIFHPFIGFIHSPFLSCFVYFWCNSPLIDLPIQSCLLSFFWLNL